LGRSGPWLGIWRLGAGASSARRGAKFGNAHRHRSEAGATFRNGLRIHVGSRIQHGGTGRHDEVGGGASGAKTVVRPYKEKTFAWDVVNEAFDELRPGTLRSTIWQRPVVNRK
jgi:hypothetical protein